MSLAERIVSEVLMFVGALILSLLFMVTAYVMHRLTGVDYWHLLLLSLVFSYFRDKVDLWDAS